MNKKIMYSTMGILAVASMGSMAAFGVYQNKYHTAQVALDGINEGAKFVAITSHVGTDEFTKIYDVQDGEKTLQDLLLHHSSDFKMSAPYGSMGRMTKGVFSPTSPHALYTPLVGWWTIKSDTYISHHPEADGSNGVPADKGNLAYGAVGLYLTFSESFDFYYNTP